MMADSSPIQLEFSSFGRRKVTASFDGGHLSSDGGALLLREVDKRIGLLPPSRILLSRLSRPGPRRTLGRWNL